MKNPKYVILSWFSNISATGLEESKSNKLRKMKVESMWPLQA